MIDAVNSYLGFVLLLAAIGAILDQVTPDRSKDQVALYVFGLGTGLRREFEQGVIAAIVGIFIHENGNIIKRRVALLTLFSSAAFSFFVFYLPIYLAESATVDNFSEKYEGEHGKILGKIYFIFSYYVTIMLLCVAVSFPFDLFSLKISKNIFINKNLDSKFLLFYVLLDILISSIPLFIFMLVIFLILFFGNLIFRFDDDLIYKSSYIAVAAPVIFAGNLFTSILNSIIQLIVTFFGYFLRIIMYISRINQWFIIYSKFHNFPFTFLMTFFGLAVIFLSLVHKLSEVCFT